jgi:hypothetical protein
MKMTKRKWTMGISLMLLGILGASLSIATLNGGEGDPKTSDMVVHEWGTFLAMNGSDGVGLEGMYHEEHSLPGFVHARSRDQLRLPSVSLKGETPVIYFYTDRAQEARIDVKFPKGIWTQWYPQAQIVAPAITQSPSPSQLIDGRIRWRAEIIPANTPGVTVPATSADALWNYAREVDAAYVRTHDFTRPNSPTEMERYIFYRGLGQSNLPLQFTAAEGGTMSLPKDDRFGVKHVFVLRVDGDKASYSYRSELKPGETIAHVIPAASDAQPIAEFTMKLCDDLAARLIESGLYEKEARAMVNTWRSSYFQTPGVRALFVMPQAWTDDFIPLKITPTPKQTVRVMVGRTELLTSEREQQAEQAIADLGSNDSAVRQEAFDTLEKQGRYVEPIVRRVMNATTNSQIKTLCQKLLTTEFVTELKSALKHVEGTSDRLEDNPLHARAQLALLLSEIGQAGQAKEEGKAVLELLAKTSAPAMNDADFRSYARAHAKAMEATGDLKGSAEWYDKFVTFGAQALNTRECRFCHRDSGPEEAKWFRTWWAGPKYASYIAKKEGLQQAISRLNKDQRNPAIGVKLAYLLEANGDMAAANTLWNQLEKEALPRGDVAAKN